MCTPVVFLLEDLFCCQHTHILTLSVGGVNSEKELRQEVNYLEGVLSRDFQLVTRFLLYRGIQEKHHKTLMVLSIFVCITAQSKGHADRKAQNKSLESPRERKLKLITSMLVEESRKAWHFWLSVVSEKPETTG